MLVFPLSSPLDISLRPNVRDSRYEWQSFVNRLSLRGYKIDQPLGGAIGIFRLQFNSRPRTHFQILMEFYAKTYQWADPFLYWSASLNRYFVVKGTSVPELRREGFNPAIVSFGVTLEEQPYVNLPAGYLPTTPVATWTNDRAAFFGNFQTRTTGTYRSAVLKVSTQPGDMAIFTYLGNGARIFSPKGPDGGLIEVWFDGVNVTTIPIDLYAPTETASDVIYDGITGPNAALHSANQLHVIKLINKSTDPTKRALYVDAIEFVYTGVVP